MKKSKSQFKIQNFLVVISFFIFVTPAHANELEIYPHKTEVRENEQFLVDVIVNSNEAINAIEGEIVFPAEQIVVKEIRDADSVINFWVEAPHEILGTGETTEGKILFSGITPGGFSGPRQNLFSVLFAPKSTGVVAIYPSSVRALKSDGEGTEAELQFNNAGVVILPGSGQAGTRTQADTDAPEDFALVVSQSPHLFDNRYFLVFATEDKGSGVANYKVREFRFPNLSFLSPLRIAESPYQLRDQELKSHIVVVAYDRQGNEREVRLVPQNTLSPRDYWPFAVIIILTFALLLFGIRKLWRRS